jgi:chemotaxis protein MotA
MTERTYSYDAEPRLGGTSPGLLGMGVALTALILLTVYTVATSRQFIDIPSIALVLGGTIGATLLQYSIAEVHQSLRLLRLCFAQTASSPFERVQILIDLAHTVREHGLLALENAALRTEDPFLQTGLRIAADGDRMHDLRPILENEMLRAEDRLEHAAAIIGAMGNYAPAMGLIGTLIGLIQMLSSLNDPTHVGPSMSLALVSTLYGSLAANICFLPLSGKIRSRNDQETLTRRITIEGVIGLATLESPTVLSQKLRSFVAGTTYDG